MISWFPRSSSPASKKPHPPPASPPPDHDAHKHLTQRFQDLSDAREKYEGLLAQGQNVSAAAFDFADSLRDMASYMIETFGEFIDADIGGVSSTLGNVQMEIFKLIQTFIHHVSETIVKPSEAMITEIQEAEVLKERYIEAWDSFKRSKTEKKPRKGKGNQGSTLVEEVKKQADIVDSHIQYLFQNQSQNLLTQLARYHTSQLYLFRNGLRSIDRAEPLMKQLAQKRKIDRTLLEMIPDERVDHGKAVELKSDDETSVNSSPQRYSGPQCNSSDTSGEIHYEDKRPEGNSISAPSSPLLHFTRADGCDSTLPTYALPLPTSVRQKWTPHTTQRNSDKGSGAKVYYSGSIIDSRKTVEATKACDSRVSEDYFVHRQGRTAMPVEVADDDPFHDGKSRKYSHSGTMTGGPSVNIKYTPTNNVRNQVEPGPTNNVRNQVEPGPGRPVYSASPVSPQISELHKLPLPPPGMKSPSRSPVPSSIQYSAPLPRTVLPKSRPLSPLPPPPPVTRSLSIPSSGTSSKEFY